jgi:hypothetical protein
MHATYFTVLIFLDLTIPSGEIAVRKHFLFKNVNILLNKRRFFSKSLQILNSLKSWHCFQPYITFQSIAFPTISVSFMQIYLYFQNSSSDMSSTKEEHRLRAYENIMRRKIFWAKKEKITGSWSKPYRQKNDDYSSVCIFSLIWARRREHNGVY